MSDEPWPIVGSFEEGVEPSSVMPAAKLSAQSVDSITGSALGSPGFRRFAFATAVLILVLPMVLVGVGAFGGPSDTSRAAQIGWGVALGLAGLGVLWLAASGRTVVNWEGLRRGTQNNTSIPWGSVKGFVVEPQEWCPRQARLLVVHSDAVEGMRASMVPNGLCQASTVEVQASADKLNAELGLSEPIEAFQAVRQRGLFDLTQGWTYLLIMIGALVSFGILGYLALLTLPLSTMRRSTWLFSIATVDLVGLACVIIVNAQSGNPITAPGFEFVFWLSTPLLFLVLAIRSRIVGRAREERTAS
jgi:hypothetical protein